MAVTPPDQDPLIDALQAAAHQPDPARAQALEDQLTARLEQLTQNTKRTSNMQAQPIYTRRPLPNEYRAWQAVLTSAALIVCAALVVLLFPRPTPPSDLMVAPPNLDTDPTPPPMTATPFSAEAQPTVIQVFPTGTLITREQPTELLMTATPLPGAGSFTDATSVPYPTATPFGMSVIDPTPLQLEPADAFITISTGRLFYIRPTDFTPDQLAAGDRLSLSLPVVTVTHLPNANLMSLLPAGVVELVPVGTGVVVLSDISQGILTIQLDEPVNFQWVMWARNPDNQALIAFDLLNE